MFGIFSTVGLFGLFAAGTLRRAAVAFAAVLCLYGLKQWGQASSMFFAQHRTYANFAVATLAVVGLWRRSFESGSARSMNTVWILVIALYLYSMLTLVWTPGLDAALEQWRQQVPYVLTVAVIAPLLIGSSSDMRIACEWAAVLGGALCTFALVSGHWGNRGLLVIGDLYEQETNPLAIASLGGTVALIAIVSAVSSTAWSKKVLFSMLIPVGLAVVLRSGSRGQLVAVLGALVVGLPLATRKRSVVSWCVAAVAATAVLVLTVWLFKQLGVDSDRWTTAQSSEAAEGRMGMATTLLGTALESPLTFFAGLGNSSSFHYIGFYSHIAPLEVLAEEGLVGFILYASILVLAFKGILLMARTARMHDDQQSRFSAAALGSLFIFEWLLTFKQGSLLSSVYVMAYAALAGRLSPTLELESHEGDAVSPVPTPVNQYANLMS
jgi:hypothetical protein